MIDATHPFAAQMSRQCSPGGGRNRAPFFALCRPAWQQADGDRWIDAGSVADAIGKLGKQPRRVFVALGRQELAPLGTAPQHSYLVRSVDPVDPPLDVPDARYILDRGPFGIAAERTLLSENRIDAIVAKNSGGDATYAKIAAARDLGIEVVLVRRPPRRRRRDRRKRRGGSGAGRSSAAACGKARRVDQRRLPRRARSPASRPSR